MADWYTSFLLLPVSMHLYQDMDFLALAVLIFGQWKPGKILLAALFFGIMKTISSAYSGIPILADFGIPSSIYKMIPYLATLIVLALNTKGSQAPKASGIPYDKGAR